MNKEFCWKSLEQGSLERCLIKVMVSSLPNISLSYIIKYNHNNYNKTWSSMTCFDLYGSYSVYCKM